MNRATVGLAALAGLMLVMLTFGGVCFLAGAAYLALAEHMSPWLAALIVAGVMLLPLFLAIGRLSWIARQRRLRKQHRFGALKAVFSDKAKADPYGFMGTAFMSGITLATSVATRRRIAEFMAAQRNAQSGG